MISLVAEGSVPCLFISLRIRDMPLLFSPNVIKIYNQPVPVPATAGFCLSSKVQFWTLMHAYTQARPNYLLPASIHTWICFLQWGIKQYCVYQLLTLYVQKETTDMCLKVSPAFSNENKFFRRGSWDDPFNSNPSLPACYVIVVSTFLTQSFYWFYWNYLNSFYLWQLQTRVHRICRFNTKSWNIDFSLKYS